MKISFSKNKETNRAGFTFVEIMITFTMFMILASVGVGAYFRYYHFSLVSNDVGKITKVLHETRFKAMKNPFNSDYGVYLNNATNEMITYRDSYTPGNAENVVTELQQLSISNLNLQPSPGVTHEILFENKTGKTANSGSFTVIKDELSFTYYINQQGAFEQ